MIFKRKKLKTFTFTFSTSLNEVCINLEKVNEIEFCNKKIIFYFCGSNRSVDFDNSEEALKYFNKIKEIMED